MVIMYKMYFVPVMGKGGIVLTAGPEPMVWHWPDHFLSPVIN